MTDVQLDTAAAPRAPLPVWLMGLTATSFGVFGGVLVVTVPQLLASVGTPEAIIAGVTGLAMFPGVFGFLIAPILDMWLARRTWAILFAFAAAGQMIGALNSLHDIPRLSVLLFSGFLCAVLSAAASGGWLGTLVPEDGRGRLGAWATVGNIGGGGLTIMVAIPLLRSLPFEVGAVALAIMMLLPLIIFFWLPAPPPAEGLSKGGFGELGRDLVALVRRPEIPRLLIIFVAPAAAFALTNVLGGVGDKFHADERFVGLVAGAGGVIAGVVGSLAVPPLMKLIAPIRLYLLIGAMGAIFTGLILLLPKSPATFGLAMLGENVFQAASFATSLGIAYRSLGTNNPIASTQVALLVGASALPVVYMQFVDGRAYGLGGVNGSFIADAGLSLAACVILALLFWNTSGKRARA